MPHYKIEYDEIDLNLEFTNAPNIGPNAFALPGGTIFITDQLVKLASSNDEIFAVLVHEVGHVIQNHGMQMLIQRTGLSLFFFVVLGADDISALPMLLLNSAYSREHEREADMFAKEKLEERGWSPKLLADILKKMTDSSGRKSSGTSMLSTHPLTDERVKYLSK